MQENWYPLSQRRPIELFHLTVAELRAGNPRSPLDKALHSVGANFSSAAFDVTLTSTGRFNARRNEFSLVFEADEDTALNFVSLRNHLEGALKTQNLAMVRGLVRPHVTVAHGCFPDEAIPISPIRFRAAPVELIASREGDSQHHHLDRWVLHEALTS